MAPRPSASIPLHALLLALLVSCGGEPERVDERPNVLLITLDTTRADRLQLGEGELEIVPQLKRLAAEALVFDDFVNVSSWTLPTHASLFTGLYPTTHTAHYSSTAEIALSDAVGEEGNLPFFRANRLPEEALTLAEVLRADGYLTCGVGAGPWLKEIFGLAQGFEEYDADYESANGRTADEVSELALRFLRRRHRRPFFLFLNYFDPHFPYDAPAEDAQRFDDPYNAEIHFMDRCIGEVLDELRSSGLYERTWILVTTDHGELFDEHEVSFHGFTLYEGELRGALILKPPAGVQLDLDPDERCQQVDLMPTLLAALDIDAPALMEGEPLGAIRHPAVAELYESEGNVRWKGERFRRSLRAVYADRHKLIVSTRPDDRDAGLFDLEADPHELEDLRESEPQVLEELQARLEAWKAALLAPLEEQEVPSLDAATLEELEKLGYLGDESPD